VGQPGQARGALRLTFSYDGERVELVSRQRVQMTLPASHPLDEGEGQSGFWFTLRAEDGRPLYRRVSQSPIRVDAEVFSPEPTQNIQRVAIAHPRGRFVLLVPDITEARTLTLHMHPVEPGAQARPAREIASFPLGEATGTEG
jgi:hypothetical protein